MRLVFLIIFCIFTLEAKTYTDLYNRDINIQSNQKIVAIGPGSLRLIIYLQLEKKLIGIENSELKSKDYAPYRNYLDQNFIQALPIIGQGGPGKMPNIESLITLKPNIIFATLLSKEQIELIQQKTNIPVVALSYGTIYNKSENRLQTIKKSIQLIAQIMDKTKRANELLSFMKRQEDQLSKIKIDRSKLYIAGLSNKGVHGITSTESNYPPFTLLNIKNSILKNHIGHAFVNMERIFQYNPDVIFLDSISKKMILEQIEKNNSILKHINAFKNKQIYWLEPSNYYNTNVENIYINSWKIASYFQKDIPLNQIKEKIYKIFFKPQSEQNVQ